MLKAAIKRTAIPANQVHGLFKALADPIRIAVVELLPAGEACVCDFMKETGFAQSRISFHLKILKDSGLITDRQSGRWVYSKLYCVSLQLWTSKIMGDCQKVANC